MGNPIPGASPDVALYIQTWLPLYTDLAPFGDNHFDGCGLLRVRINHGRARKALEADAEFQASVFRQADALKDWA
jgi:hypothetical protein